MPTASYGRFEKVLRLGEGRRLKRLRDQANYIATLEPEFEALSDDELRGKTAEFRQRLDNGEQLDNLLFEAFAAVREARKRESDQRLFDVQMMGGIVLHEGDIAEMRTGEGKTFVATMPLYLNSLTGQNVHLVTVNDYLAKRDPEWVKPVFDALGIRAGFIANMMPFAERTVTGGIRGAKQRDDGRGHGSGQMHRPGIAGDEDVQAREQGRGRGQVELPGRVDHAHVLE